MTSVRRLPSERGAAMVETIMVLPILFLIMFGIVEVSRLWFTLQVATSAVREGVRTAAVASAAEASTNGELRMRAVLDAANVKWTATTVTPPQDITGISGEQEVVASATVVFETIFPLLMPSSLQSVLITQTAAMRHEKGP